MPVKYKVWVKKHTPPLHMLIEKDKFKHKDVEDRKQVW